MPVASVLDKKECTVGMRVQDLNGNAGTVRWMGRMEKAQRPPKNDTGTYLAVEMDAPTGGLDRTDGTWEGQQYCQAAPGTVVFKKPNQFHRELNPEAIKELREKFGDRIAALSDVQLIKFCIARKYDMPKVCEMIEKDLKWRGEFKPGFDEYFDEGMAADYPVGYCDGLDRDGNLLYYERPGNGGACHPKDFVKKYGIGQIVRWHVAGMELGKAKMADSGYKSKRVTVLIDLTKLGDTDSGVRAFAKAIAAVDQDHYPEHLARMFIVNAPGLFTAIWSVIKIFIDERTKNKIFILGPKESAKVISEFVDPSLFPSFIGGTNDSYMAQGGRIGSTDPNKRINPETVEVELPPESPEVSAPAK